MKGINYKKDTIAIAEIKEK